MHILSLELSQEFPDPAKSRAHKSARLCQRRLASGTCASVPTPLDARHPGGPGGIRLLTARHGFAAVSEQSGQLSLAQRVPLLKGGSWQLAKLLKEVLSSAAPLQAGL